MTDRDVPDASELDELASAIVDGEATPAQLERAADPAVAARVREFEAVRRLVATPVEPLDDVARARLLRAALAAGSPPARRAPRWLAPAAAAVVVLAGLGLFLAALAGGGGSGDEIAGRDPATEATALAETFEESAGDAAAGGAEGSGTAAASPAPATTGLTEHVGAVTGVEELETVLRERAARVDDAGEGSAERGGPGLCLEGVEGDVVAVVGATLDGREVVVAVLRRPDGGLAYRASASGSCELVAAGEL